MDLIIHRMFFLEKQRQQNVANVVLPTITIFLWTVVAKFKELPQKVFSFLSGLVING